MKIDKRIVLLVSLLLLTSCSRNNLSSNPSSISSSSITISSDSLPLSSELSSIVIDPLAYYESELIRLEELKKDTKKLYLSSNVNRDNLIDEANRSYWKGYSSLIEFTKEALRNINTRNRFVEKFGEFEVTYLENIDTKKIFFNREFPSINYESVIKNGNSILENIKNNHEIKNVLSSFESFIGECEKLMDAYCIYNIYKDLYVDKSEYLIEFNDISKTYNEVENIYNKIYKDLLLSSFYKQETINYFSLSEKDVENILKEETFEDEIIGLFNEETELINRYGDQNYDQKELYLSLVNIRREIASKLGYDNYLDYVYSSVYKRDYTMEEGSTLIDNIILSDTLTTMYRTTKVGNMDYRLIGEYDLLEGLKNVSNVVSSSPKVLKDLITYGNYSFESRENKYGGSYKITLDSTGANYMFIATKGNIIDYTTVFHEYGHYLSSMLNKKEPNIDVAEIQSQGLEFLMSNYYSSFLDSKETKYMIEYNTTSQLWTLMSASLITRFENYVYTVDNIDLNEINRMYPYFESRILYPYSLGPTGYVNIPHIYNSPGYYISYLVSVVPALELWAENKMEDGISKYNKILLSNDMTFKDALNKANIISPFKKEAIEMIERRFNQIG